MEELQPDRRSQPRFAVDAEASLVAVNRGAPVHGRLFELSLDGCRVRADRPLLFTTPVGVEIGFNINRIAFRLAGTMQWIDAHQTAGIEFGSMVPRRREALLEVLAELAEEESKEAAEKATPPEPEQNEQSLPQTNSNVLSITAAAAESHPAGDARSGVRERRAQKRHAVDTSGTIYLIDVRAQVAGRILDISMSGCRIRTAERFPVGIYRRVETEFRVDGLPFRLAGVVQSLHDKFNVGIRFLDMSPRKQEQLAQLMQEIEEAGNREENRE